MLDERRLDWDKLAGLLPAVVQELETGRVLMLGYMNREALDRTLELGRVTFFSRSKKRLWTKGESSGNYLELVAIDPDCDGDALLVLARARGPACHLGRTSCFEDLGKHFREPGEVKVGGGSASDGPGKHAGPCHVDRHAETGIDVLEELDRTIAGRRGADPVKSYTARLLAQGTTRIARKLGEESVETVLAAVDESDERLADESADLVFHLLVLLHSRGLSLRDVTNRLAARRRSSRAP